MSEIRKCLRRQDDGSFAECGFRDLKAGDIFQLFEATGEPVDGGGFLKALGDASPQENPDAYWYVKYEDEVQ